MASTLTAEALTWAELAGQYPGYLQQQLARGEELEGIADRLRKGHELLDQAIAAGDAPRQERIRKRLGELGRAMRELDAPHRRVQVLRQLMVLRDLLGDPAEIHVRGRDVDITVKPAP